MINRPADAPSPLPRLAGAGAIQTLKAEYAGQHQQSSALSPRLRFRRWAGRVSGRADRRLITALVDAVDVLTERCDAIADRLESQDALVSEIAGSFGSELASLRAEVGHLRASAGTRETPRGA